MTYRRCIVDGCYNHELSDGRCYGHAGMKLASDFERALVLVVIGLPASVFICLAIAVLVKRWAA